MVNRLFFSIGLFVSLNLFALTDEYPEAKQFHFEATATDYYNLVKSAPEGFFSEDGSFTIFGGGLKYAKAVDSISRLREEVKHFYFDWFLTRELFEKVYVVQEMGKRCKNTQLSDGRSILDVPSSYYGRESVFDLFEVKPELADYYFEVELDNGGTIEYSVSMTVNKKDLLVYFDKLSKENKAPGSALYMVKNGQYVLDTKTFYWDCEPRIPDNPY